ncbi:MAG: hypothetical protein GXP37_01495 [Chloroflexi bacterium]|nr:hypothetical protein [Chloroflexota bacterium]
MKTLSMLTTKLRIRKRAPLVGIAVVIIAAALLGGGNERQQPQPVAMIDIGAISAAAGEAWNPGISDADTCSRCPTPQPPSGEPPAWRLVPPGGPDLPPTAPQEGKAIRRSNYFVQQRAYPLDDLPLGSFDKALAVRDRQRRQSINAQAVTAVWQPMGPAPMKNSQLGAQKNDVSGRAKAIAVDPRNGNVVYVGAALGGVWKTSNGGSSWTPLTDDQPSLSTGVIVLDPQHPDTIYVGTGEPTPGGDNYYGVGILKSTNGGASWQHLGKEVFTGLGMSNIVINPNNPQVLYAATARTAVMGPQVPARGIFKSTDGGQSWTGLMGCTDMKCWGASDIVMNPKNPAVLYAAFWSYGIYKSTDRGANWTKLTNGLPPSNFGRIELGISPSNPNVLYAGYQYSVPDRYDGALVFKTTDGGASWQQLQAPNYCTGQCWYDNIIVVHPQNPNTVYVGGSANYQWQPVTRIRQVVIRTTDGGANWQDMTPNDAPNTTLHPDMHAIAFDPSNPNIIWVGNDGGVWKTTNGGQSWINRNNGLGTLQFTGVDIHPTNASILFGGMQDNNKAITHGNTAWDALDVGDGGYAAIDPFNPTIFYGSRYGISFQRNGNGGSAPVDDWPVKTDGIDRNDRALFYAPFALDKARAGIVYYGTHRLYRSTNRGESWSAISGDLTRGQQTGGSISTIAPAQSDTRVIYVGSSDGNVQVTANDGQSWTNVSKAPLPNRWVSEIAVPHNNANVAYVVFNGFNTHTPDTPGHVFKTNNRGQSWQDISGNLPDTPVLSIVLDKTAAGTITIGTDVGVYRSTNGGGSWQPLGTGLPNVPVVDLALNTDLHVLIAGTHGRSVWKLDLGGSPAPTDTPRPPTATPTTNPATATPTIPPFTPAHTLYLPVSLHTQTIQHPTATLTPQGTSLPTTTPTVTPTTGPTRTPTATPGGPTPTTTPIPSPLVFADDFSNPGSGWATGVTSSCQRVYSNGEYGMAVLQTNWVCLSSAPQPQAGDMVVQVEARKDSSPDGSVYGLIFGLADPNTFSQFYVFWVDPADGTYIVQKYDNGWSNITNVEFTANIHQADQSNQLRVRRAGSQIRLYINDGMVNSFTDDAFTANTYTGVAIWSAYDSNTAISYFDDFKISVPTRILYDDFGNSSSGWFTGAIQVCQAGYQNGEYVTTTAPNYSCFFRSPGGSSPNGLFQVTARRGESVYPTVYGLMIGEDGSFSTFYTLLITPDSQEYVLAKFNGSWLALTWDQIEDDAWQYSPLIRPGSSSNRLQVVRDANRLDLFVNDNYLETVYDDSLQGDGYFGVINWASEYTPVTSFFDDFSVLTWEEQPALNAQFGAQLNSAAGPTLSPMSHALTPPAPSRPPAPNSVRPAAPAGIN